MNDSKFWKLLDAAHQQSSTAEGIDFLETALQKESSDNIIRFLNIYRRKMKALLLKPVADSCFLLTGERTEDIFEDFRAWLIFKGKKVCALAIEQPDSLLEEVPDTELSLPVAAQLHFAAHRAFAAQLNIEADSEDYLDCLLAFEENAAIKPLAQANEELLNAEEPNVLAKDYPALYQNYMLNVDMAEAPILGFQRPMAESPVSDLPPIRESEPTEAVAA